MHIYRVCLAWLLQALEFVIPRIKELLKEKPDALIFQKYLHILLGLNQTYIFSGTDSHLPFLRIIDSLSFCYKPLQILQGKRLVMNKWMFLGPEPVLHSFTILINNY